MDDRHVDDLARSIAGGTTRRAALRLLAGGALGGLAARLGLAGIAEAKTRRRAEQDRQGKLQVEGKGKGKNGKKGKKKPKRCGPGEHRCGPGPCIPVHQCCSNQKRCSDGSCVAAGECCRDEHRCGPGPCIPIHQCCSNQKRCDDGSCIPEDECCEDLTIPLCDSGCQEVICDNGEWVCGPVETGSPCQLSGGGGQGICCGGGCDQYDVTCSGIPWREFNPATCNCECTGGSTETSGNYFCCPAGFPHDRPGGMCCPSGQSSLEDCVCMVGFHTCPWSDYECCGDGTNADRAESASTGIGGAAASGAEDIRLQGTTPGRRSSGRDLNSRKGRRHADGPEPGS